MDSLHATIEEFAAEGFTHVECFCPQCRMTRLRPISWLLQTCTGARRHGVLKRRRRKSNQAEEECRAEVGTV